MIFNRLKQSFETNTVFRAVFAENKEIFNISPADTVRLQQALTEMLCDIDSVCKKNGLTFFLAGGSALGAVRNGGFIPWDDDIDLIMPRKDYDRFFELFEKDFSHRYWIQNIKRSKKYDVNSAKIRKKGTVCKELFESEPDKTGIFIDVYPLENVYSNPLLKKLHGYFSELMLLICSCVRMRKNKPLILPYLKDKKQIKAVKRKSAIGLLFSFLPLNKWLKLTEKVLSMCKDEKSEFVSIPSGRKHYFGEMYSRKSFFPPKEINFSGHNFYIMNTPEEYLTKLYGKDFMTPPSKENQNHLLNKIFPLKSPLHIFNPIYPNPNLNSKEKQYGLFFDYSKLDKLDNKEV